MEDLNGKVAVVTGGASGIGRAMATAFAAEGMKVVLADLDEVRMRDVEAELSERGTEVLPVLCDTSLEASVQDLARITLERFGGAHVLCNNAHRWQGQSVDRADECMGVGDRHQPVRRHPRHPRVFAHHARSG